MHEPLEELLTHLKEATAAAEEGADNQAEIAALTREVERRLGEQDPEGVVDELRDHVQRFEVSHPSLAATIGRAADALSAMGL